MSATPLTPHLTIVLGMIEAAGSISGTSLASQYGCTHEHMQTLLRRLRERGLVVRIGGAVSSCWVLASMSEQARAEHKHACRLRFNARQRAYQSEQKACTEAENDKFISGKPRQITVPAHLCAPIRTKAPASVFHLAQCAGAR